MFGCVSTLISCFTFISGNIQQLQLKVLPHFVCYFLNLLLINTVRFSLQHEAKLGNVIWESIFKSKYLVVSGSKNLDE